MDALRTSLTRRKPADLGILLTSGCVIPDIIAGITGYHPVDIGEVLRLNEQEVGLDHARLEAWVRAILDQTKKPMIRYVGRPSVRDGVLSIFSERRAQKLPYESKLSEAKAIRKMWQTRFPDTKVPSLSAVRGHLLDTPENRASEVSPPIE
jgi:hypothetical protein